MLRCFAHTALQAGRVGAIGRGKTLVEILKTDICILGGGAAGQAAAYAARARGTGVVLVEPGALGGIALDRGSLAAHALAASGKRAHQVRTARALGIGAQDPRINFARVNAHIGAVVAAAAPEVSAERLTAEGITIVREHAAFIDRRTLTAGDTHIRARRYIVATGSRPVIPDIPGLDTVPFHTPETIFEITRKPGHLIVFGGGETGLALAQAHLRLGAKVTLIDILSPLGDCDAELADIVLRRLAAEGLDIRPNTGVVSVAGTGDGVDVTIKTGAEERTIAGTHLLVATGRRPDIDALGLDKAGALGAPSRRARDGLGRTANARIYLLGDADTDARSVHDAQSQAHRVVDHALGRGLARPKRPVAAHVIYTDPEIAQVGLTETGARARYKTRFTITRFPFASIDRARALGETDGHVKIMSHENGRILGAGIAGPQAGELISIFSLAIACRLTPYDLTRLVVPHPALGEIVTAVARAYADAHPQAGWRRWLGGAPGR